MARNVLLAGIGVAFALVALAAPRLAAAAVTRAAGDPPNIVLILSDDQRWDTVTPAVMPTVTRELAGKGTTFTNAFVSNPLCCPSRATLLTGRYSHGTGVYGNSGPHGGFGAFDDRSTIATWLHARGYRTALVGKYLNHYQSLYIPPGWDHWFSFVTPNGSAGQEYYGYTINDNGVEVSHGNDPSDYSTDVLAADADAFIRETQGPLFLYFAPNAPHFDVRLNATPPPRHQGALDGLLAPWRPPSYNEKDVADKPRWIRNRTRFTPEQMAAGDHYRQSQLETLMGLDDAVGGILQALQDTGRLHNTLVVFMSDNGLLWGEHRWFSKTVPYDEALRVPMIVRYDPVTGGAARRDGHFVLNVDVAPTFAAAAGAPAPRAEGRSLWPLLRRRGVKWRSDFLIEGGFSPPVKPYCGVRSTRYAYVQYGRSRPEELYDLALDPYERVNLAARGPHRRTIVAFRRRLRALCSPPPPGIRLRSPCLVAGTSRGDLLRGTRFYDLVCGRGGDDRILADRGDDVVDAGRGDDRVYGGSGADRLYGGPGSDVIRALDGERDVVGCGPGSDKAIVDPGDVVRGCETVRVRH